MILSTYGTEIRTRIPLHKTPPVLADGVPEKDIAAEDADEISWKKKRKRKKATLTVNKSAKKGC